MENTAPAQTPVPQTTPTPSTPTSAPVAAEVPISVPTSPSSPMPASTSTPASPLNPTPTPTSPPTASEPPQSGGNSFGKVIAVMFVAIILALAVGAGAYYAGGQLFPGKAPAVVEEPTPTPDATFQACTLEAKVCPDGTTVGRTGPNCEFAECSPEASGDQATKSAEVKPGTKFIVAAVSKQDTEGNDVAGTRANLVLTLPTGSKVGEKTVVLKNVEYSVVANMTAGLCSNEEYDASMCSYTDEEYKTADMLRLWKDKSGIFGVNFATINVDGYYLTSIVITKTGTNKTFTTAEITQWKQIYDTLKAEKVTQ